MTRTIITHMMRDIQKQPQEVTDQRRAKYRSFQENDFELLESDRAMFDWAGKADVYRACKHVDNSGLSSHRLLPRLRDFTAGKWTLCYPRPGYMIPTGLGFP